MPRFDKTYCSQCGGEFGPGDSGFSHCQDHPPYAKAYNSDLYATADSVACPACTSTSGSPRFIDCGLCGNEGVVSEQIGRDWAPAS